jgi:hypothetical protein
MTARVRALRGRMPMLRSKRLTVTSADERFHVILVRLQRSELELK